MFIKDLQKYKTILQEKFIFVVLFITILVLEVFGFNHRFFVKTLFRLEELELRIEEGTLYGFDLENGRLISEHNDPNITFRNIDKHVRYINLECTNPNLTAQSQIFFRRIDEDFTEENSILFSLHASEILVSLPSTIKVTSLRFDLTNKPDDMVSCQRITLNPAASFHVSYFRFALLLLSIVGLIFSKKFISPKYSIALWNALLNNGVWVFAFLIILIGLAYPVTITFDSAHFLWLADHIRNGNWASWDPIRNVGYPMQLFLSTRIFGDRAEALLWPMILAHVLLFIFSCQIAVLLLEPKKDNQRFLIYLTLFIAIGLDPTVVGYFHVLLTEYLAATIAMISCFMALKLYQTELFSKQFFLLSIYFLFMVPISWLLKQPYLGAAYFPFIIACALMVLRRFSIKTVLLGVMVNSVLIIFVLMSVLIWRSFLETNRNPMEADRQFSTIAERRIDRSINNFRRNPVEMINKHIKQYLVSTNYLRTTPSGDWGEPSLTYAFQNRAIAQRMFLNPGSSNKLYEFPRYDPYTQAYKDFYTPPNWLNNFFQSRINSSNFLFTATYLFLPLIMLIFFIRWIRKKSLYNSGFLILGGTSLFNAIAHLLGSPIDRYLFMGYPLNLLILVVGIISVIGLIYQSYGSYMPFTKEAA
jgi:hypothetical protein